MLLVFELSFLNHVVFCFMFLDLFRNMFPLQCVLYLFISSFRSSSFHLFSLFCLFLFSRFFHLFLPLILNFLFFGLSIIFMFLCVKHCAQKKMYLFRLQQNSLFLSSHFLKKNSVFSVSFFVEPFFTLIYVPCFFCFFPCLENGFSFCFTQFNFFHSVSLHFSIFWYPKLKIVVAFLENTLENSIFCF